MNLTKRLMVEATLIPTYRLPMARGTGTCYFAFVNGALNGPATSSPCCRRGSIEKGGGGSLESRVRGANQSRDAWKAKLLRARRRLTVAAAWGAWPILINLSNVSDVPRRSRCTVLRHSLGLASHYLSAMDHTFRRQTSFGIRRLYGRITGSLASKPLPVSTPLPSFTHPLVNAIIGIMQCSLANWNA